MGAVVKLEEALSARSTCRITGEQIGKGELRVGFDGWAGGRMVTQWQKLLPLLNACYLEHCPTNRGSCKKTSNKFQKGEVRMAIANNDSKVHLSLPAAAEELAPLLDAAGEQFSPLSFKGLQDLTQEGKDAFYAAFHLDPKEKPLQSKVVNGKTSQGKAGKEGAPQLKAAKEKTSEGKADKEGAPQGKAVKEKTVQGKLAKGKAPDGKEDEEEALKDKAAKRKAPQGKAAKSRVRRGGKVEQQEPEEEPQKRGQEPEEAAQERHPKRQKQEAPAKTRTQPSRRGAAKQETRQEPKSETESKDEASPNYDITPGPEAASHVMDEDMKHGSGADEDEPMEDGLTEYERQRQLHIQRNRKRLMALQLPALAKEVLATPAMARAATTRGVSSKKLKTPREPVVLRQSSRIRGITVEDTFSGGILSENRDGSVVLASGALQAVAERARHAVGPLPFMSENGNSSSDEAFLKQLHSAASYSEGDAKGSGGGKHHSYYQMSLDEQDVAKVTKDGVTVMAFHPSSSSLILAAGDKAGKLGLWHIDQRDSEEEYDGVLMFGPHYQYISGLKWLTQGGTADKLLTVSYDGSVRVLDAQVGQFLQVSGIPADAEFSCAEVAEDSQLVLLGDPDGELFVLDMRAGKLVHEGLSLHSRKINTLHLEPSDQRLLASAGTDAAVHVWDIRQVTAADVRKTKPLVSGYHQKSCQAAYWSPDGYHRLLSTSFDNTLQVWHDPKWSLAKQAACLGTGPAHFNLVKQHMIKHDNNTGRWLSPFKAVWGVEGDAILVGDMARGVACFGSEGQTYPLLRNDHMTAIPTRLCVHPTLQLLAASTSSGRVHIYR